MIVNDVRYDSLPGFMNRKAAEQSAAEVALIELAKSSDANASISQPAVSVLFSNIVTLLISLGHNSVHVKALEG